MGILVVSKNHQYLKVILICLSSGSSSERLWSIPWMTLGASSFYCHFFFYKIGSLKLLPLPHATYSLFPIPKQNNTVIASTIFLFSILAIALWLVCPIFLQKAILHLLCSLWLCLWRQIQTTQDHSKWENRTLFKVLCWGQLRYLTEQTHCYL